MAGERRVFVLPSELDLPDFEVMMEDMPQASNVGVPDGRRYFIIRFRVRGFFLLCFLVITAGFQ
ncbi:unnamed protein product [Acanthoscelides obtectus]|uniref:Uncharacterized protein n=1 Tax=Acanthoscelides obtectus TaxID=200917 RepID=A0A9P0KB35_ACAOB|nr:unnamed protein product [Acanthoscelides obtectus]CAK1643034.1 hypothetical protein AOBTE_LOCUS13382 [Acanthoscelides obtectus]